MFEAKSESVPPEPWLPEHPLPEYPRLTLHRGFRSNFLHGDRDLIVYVPETYQSEGTRTFPVLYLHDGQNLFDGRTSYIPGRTWRIQQTADSLIAADEVEPLIIVGIYNTGLHRVDEYTPTRDRRIGAGGQSALYARMLIVEIMPLIASQYRVAAGPGNMGVGGSSLGGLLSLYLGLEHRGVFGKVAVLSPSVWWDNRSILAWVRRASMHRASSWPESRIRPEVRLWPELRLWMDMGTAEGKRGLADADLLHNLLLQRGWVDGVDLRYLRVEGATHDEEAWSKRVGPMLKFLFPAR